MNFFAKNYARLKWWLTPKSRKDAVLKSALDSLRVFPPLADLLKLAEEEGISIGFDSRLIGTPTAGQVRQQKDEGKAYLDLAPSLSAGAVASILVHELRHVWQNKVLGLPPGTVGAGDADPQLSLILTRVKEADAYAFSEVLIRHMNEVAEKLSAVIRDAQKMAAAQGLSAPAQEHFTEASRRATEAQAREPAPDIRKELAEEFTKWLGKLGSYDVDALRSYHVRYTHPLYEPMARWTRPDGTQLSLKQVRSILDDAQGESYLGPMDDRAFTDLVLKDVDPGIRKTLSLMEKFEAAAKRAPANDNRELAEEIDDGVHAALKSLKKKGLKPF